MNCLDSILVVTAEGPHCLCSAKWKNADKFDYKIHMYKSGETFGQRIKWASKDFLDISYAILNSTGHQMTLRTESKAPKSYTDIDFLQLTTCYKIPQTS